MQVTDEMVEAACFAFGDVTNSGLADTAYPGEIDLKAPVRAALSAALSKAEPVGVVVPDGWQLVPIEPTVEMLKPFGGKNSNNGGSNIAGYREMLAAAPTLSLPGKENGDTLPPVVERALFEALAKQIEAATVTIEGGAWCDGEEPAPYRDFFAAMVRHYARGIPPVDHVAGGEPLDKATKQKLWEALRFSASRSVITAEDERRILNALAPEGSADGR